MAEITEVPVATPVTTPLFETVALAGVALFQKAAIEGWVLLSDITRVAVSLEVLPIPTAGLAGDTVTEDGVGMVGVCPLPESATVRGEPCAFEAMLSVSEYA